MNTDLPILNDGALGVVCGPMKSGKSRILVDLVTRLGFQNNITFKVFKPAIDTRSNKITTRDGKEIDCVVFDDVQALKEAKEYLIIVDEAQFCSKEIINVVSDLCKEGKHVIVFGLDLDSDGNTFGPMGALLAHADYVRKVNAFCDDCGKYSRFSEHQGQKDEQIKVGDAEYKAKCRTCYNK